MAQPLIIQYTNLLHKYDDPTAPPVKAFLEENSRDEAFRRRAEVLNKVFELKRQLVNPELKRQLVNQRELVNS